MDSGIRNINKYLKVYSGGKPEFYEDDIFKPTVPIKKYEGKSADTPHENTVEEKIIEFCKEPRSRKEIQEFLGLKDRSHLSKRYLAPMTKNGLLETTELNKSKNQKYVTVKIKSEI